MLSGALRSTPSGPRLDSEIKFYLHIGGDILLVSTEVMNHERRVFDSLTLMVAAAERAIADLQTLEPPPQDLIDELILARDDVTVVAKRLVDRAPAPGV